MNGYDRRLEELAERIAGIAPEDAYKAAGGDAVLLDIRDPEEWAEGSPAGALRLGRSFLEHDVETAIPDKGKPVFVLCGSGVRSLFAAESLLQLGYRDVRSVEGGYEAWKRLALPYERPGVIAVADRQRYARQIAIPEVGDKGQAKLAGARVLIVGAGGLGSPAALYLAAAGIGTIGIVDHDTVELSNLQRQILHATDRVGNLKTQSARQSLKALNPAVQVDTYDARLEVANAETIVADYDLVVDGTDNFQTRYLLNDVCVKLRRPYVYASVFRFEGQLSVFWPAAPGDERSPCYRCLYRSPPPRELAPSCTEAGVLGVLPGVMGTLQAVEAIKLILGMGDTLVGRLLCYDALAAAFREFRTVADPECAYCSDRHAFPGYADYEAFCAGAGAA